MGTSGLNEKQQRIKEEFVRIRKTWAPQWESILRQDSDFLEAYLHLSAVPLKKNFLEDKVKEFVYIAINASSTHLFAPGIQMHLKAAIELGATREELMEVLELTSTVGVHAVNVGVPILREVLEEEGQFDAGRQFDERQQRCREQFIREQGTWDATWEALLTVDPDLFEKYAEFAAVPIRSGRLSPKVRELVLCALDAAATHLYKPGIKRHIRHAIRYGATAQEVMEVLEIVSVIGIHGALIAFPMLESGFES
jgi:alkylhydroperoxidase/carboxymuconolactone decarboxylase family protein YurZ